ncbi:MAG TPA: FtsX-like permease family protein [Accumulibacter sp.]|uniref:ABC transporter permease n=2 Tax=Accumulibacter sp. TaxID=2053492 RepID=UPI00260B55B9|nr:FtsX-like permease family protein [Accumulibacter sp.]MDS4013058.1 FtsX-like permease family protein [Accumulibacter sp.]MDS4055008.1 FtsX-like permease family protein [Accumulibacter sp.]HMV05834.1 FtsX-like permease family protein [Accumulibacter sp.]HMW64672.1 FtsX-like permease family protein [Accumulibacter sp.]HMW81712.1 FtsX-like permease family protein [Accumulibacter sp.]
MFLLRLLLKNAFRHKLRTVLTLIGLVVAICAFGLLRTIIDAWYAGVEASSSTRLVTRSSISLTFQLPLGYAQRIRAVDGVRAISWANWFGGVYITERNFFPQFAIDPASYLALYPEYVIADAEKLAFLRDRQAAVVGRGLANKFGWRIGDTIPLRGTIYPGTWTFNLRAIYDGVDAKTDENQMFVHWSLINESVRQSTRRAADSVGVYIVGIDEPNNAALISQRIDALFANSLAETLTETEKAFQLSFVSMSEAILVAIQAVSLIIIVIIMAVMANTMTMTARERLAEYATLRALGFPPGFVVRLLYGESLLIAAIGGALGVAATLPLAAAFARAAGTLFPVFQVSALTMALQWLAALIVGSVAAAWPAWRMSRIDIVDGLRHVA